MKESEQMTPKKLDSPGLRVESPKTPNSIHDFASQGDLSLIEDYLKQGGDINKKSFYGTTPLHFVVLEGIRPSSS